MSTHSALVALKRFTKLFNLVLERGYLCHNTILVERHFVVLHGGKHLFSVHTVAVSSMMYAEWKMFCFYYLVMVTKTRLGYQFVQCFTSICHFGSKLGLYRYV